MPRITVVHFADSMHGWAAGGLFLETKDGGTSWHQSNADFGVGFFGLEVKDIMFADPANGLIVGVAGFALEPGFEWLASRTSDGGARWRTSTDPRRGAINGALRAGCTTSDDVALAVGYEGGFDEFREGRGILSRDGGITWDSITEALGAARGTRVFPAAFHGVECVDGDGDLWIVGQDVCGGLCSSQARGVQEICGESCVRGGAVQRPVILHSDDTGGSWTDMSHRSPLGRGVEAGLRSVVFTDERRGWAVGFLGQEREDPRPLVLHTHSAGAEWKRQALPDGSAGVLDAVAFANGTHGMVIGEVERRPLAFATNDGGRTWRLVALPSDIDGVTDVAFVPAG